MTQAANCCWPDLELELGSKSHMGLSGLQGFSEDFPVKAMSLWKGLYEFQ